MQGREGAAAETTDRNDAPEADEPQALGAATVVDVEKELQSALDKANENYDLFLRAKAEADNVRRRAQDDVAKAHKFAVESFAESLVPVIDSLEKALEATNATPEAMREGVELTLRQLKAAFEMAVQDDGWACLGPLGQYMQQLDPSFDSRTYGYKQLSHLIRAYPTVFRVRTVRRKQGTSVMYVKLLDGNDAE